MSSKIDEILSNRTEFLSLLDKDIDQNESLHEDIQKHLKSLEESREHIKDLSKQPEHTALIPLCKRLYMPGTIVHTGEYMVTKKAYPQSYSVLKTLDQTVKDLDERINAQRNQLEKSELAVSQLLDRKKLLLGEKDEDLISERKFADDDEYQPLPMEVAGMPNEIRSDKGVAVKVGGFFDILEYEEGG